MRTAPQYQRRGAAKVVPTTAMVIPAENGASQRFWGNAPPLRIILAARATRVYLDILARVLPRLEEHG